MTAALQVKEAVHRTLANANTLACSRELINHHPTVQREPRLRLVCSLTQFGSDSFTRTQLVLLE
jgi:hypothetical protein